MSTTTATERRTGIGQTELVAVALLAVLLSGRWIAPLLDHPSISTWGTIFMAIVVQSTPFLVVGRELRHSTLTAHLDQ